MMKGSRDMTNSYPALALLPAEKGNHVVVHGASSQPRSGGTPKHVEDANSTFSPENPPGSAQMVTLGLLAIASK